MNSVIRVVLPEPPSANRWWRNVRGRMVTSKAARQYKEGVAWLAFKGMAGAKLVAAPLPVRVSVDWYRGRKSGDLDKRLGVLLDALQGCVYESDSQVVEIAARRHDADRATARVEVVVEVA